VGANVPKWRKAEFHSAFQGKQQELTSDGWEPSTQAMGDLKGKP
jgi:hypothetical protein